jgi:hypothetical protein
MERRDATPAIVVNWVRELARTLPGLLPGGPLSAVTTHRILVAVSDEHAAGTWTYVHDTWLEFRGAGDPTDEDQPFVGYARACAREQRPLDTTVLDATLPRHAVTQLRALVAGSELANLTADAAERLLATLTGRRTPIAPAPNRNRAHLAWDAALATIGAPLAATGVAAATAARLVQRLAPPPGNIETPDEHEANLLTHVVADTLRVWTANAGVRLVLLRLPFTVTIGLRDGLAESTVRLGRGRAQVTNGIAPDAVVLLEGELGPVLRNAATAAIEQLGHVRIRKA